MPSWSKVARRIRVPLGFLFAAVYLWLARPTVLSMVIAAVFVICGLLIRAAASGHVKKNEELTTTGPYSYTRNPLYLGSIILAVGFVIASRSWIVAVIAVVFFLAVYVPVIRGEEKYLREHFADFDEYCSNVPRLLPRIRPYRSIASSFSQHLYWQHREYNASLGAVLMFAALLVKFYWFAR